MERDKKFCWFREHPVKGWQLWNGKADDDRWHRFGGVPEPGAMRFDRTLPYESTKDEPEAD